MSASLLHTQSSQMSLQVVDEMGCHMMRPAQPCYVEPVSLFVSEMMMSLCFTSAANEARALEQSAISHSSTYRRARRNLGRVRSPIIASALKRGRFSAVPICTFLSRHGAAIRRSHRSGLRAALPPPGALGLFIARPSFFRSARVAAAAAIHGRKCLARVALLAKSQSAQTPERRTQCLHRSFPPAGLGAVGASGELDLPSVKLAEPLIDAAFGASFDLALVTWTDLWIHREPFFLVGHAPGSLNTTPGALRRLPCSQ